MWAQIAGTLGAAVTGAMLTEAVEMRRRSRDRTRADLRQLQMDVTAAHEQALLASTQLQALNQRVSDLLDRLNQDRRESTTQ